MIGKGSVERFLAEAKRFHAASTEEYARWERKRRDEIIRDAPEKGRNAVLRSPWPSSSPAWVKPTVALRPSGTGKKTQPIFELRPRSTAASNSES